MGLAQFGTHCVPNWKCLIKPPHVPAGLHLQRIHHAQGFLPGLADHFAQGVEQGAQSGVGCVHGKRWVHGKCRALTKGDIENVTAILYWQLVFCGKRLKCKDENYRFNVRCSCSNYAPIANAVIAICRQIQHKRGFVHSSAPFARRVPSSIWAGFAPIVGASCWCARAGR